jgi:uncharacterized protein YkwD
MRKPTMAAASMVAAMSLAVPAPALARSDRAELNIASAVNAVRTSHGLRPLIFDARLERAAAGHSRAMARSGVLTHAPSLSWRLRAPHARSSRVLGETLAWMPRRTRSLTRSVIRAWLASPPHRAALLDPRFSRIGVGRSGGGRGTFVTADLSN